MLGGGGGDEALFVTKQRCRKMQSLRAMLRLRLDARESLYVQMLDAVSDLPYSAGIVSVVSLAFLWMLIIEFRFTDYRKRHCRISSRLSYEGYWALRQSMRTRARQENSLAAAAKEIIGEPLNQVGFSGALAFLPQGMPKGHVNGPN